MSQQSLLFSTLFLLTSPFLPVTVMMTQASDVNIDDSLQAASLSEALYAFDVTTDAPVDDVKTAVRRMDVRFSFKVIGEKRYIIVATSKDADVLRELEFPAGSVVTQLPVEHIYDFLKLFSPNHELDENYETESRFATDVIVKMYVWEMILTAGTSSEHYTALWRKTTQSLSQFTRTVKPATYAVIGRYPPQLISFSSLEANALQRFCAGVMDLYGGPGSATIRITDVIPVNLTQ